MSRFKKAEGTDPRLKALVYGPTGCGKTVTALQFPDPVVVDAERGTVHYSEQYDFQVDNTSNINHLMRDIDDLIEDSDGVKTLVVDPLTIFMDKIVLEHLKKLRLKKNIPDYELQPTDHTTLKNTRKELMDKMLMLDLNIVCTARQKEKYRTEGKNFMVPDGWQPDLPKEVPHMFDTIIRIEIDGDGETRIAHTEKDRTNKLPKMFEFTYDKMVEYLGIDGLSRKADTATVKDRVDKANGRSHIIDFRGKRVRTAGVTEKTLEQILATAKVNGVAENQLAVMIKDSYGYSTLYDLKEDEGIYLIKTLENLK